MKAAEFVARCRNVAEQIPTIYLKGAFGAPITESYLARMRSLYPLWYHDARMRALAPYTDRGIFGFDCVCFIKGILRGWDADVTKIYGGAAYEKNGIPDLTVDGMREKCSGLSADFKRIEPGELVFVSGHVGVYLGDGLCAECTPAFGGGACGLGGVIISACNRKCEGYPTRYWKEHGRLAFVEYPEPEDAPVSSACLPILKRGDKGEAVRALQALLNLRLSAVLPAMLATDASFGPATEGAVREWRSRRGMEESGEVDEEVWCGLMGSNI